MVDRFVSAGRPGAYLRVLVQGAIAAGDRIRVERDAAAAAAPSVADLMAWRRGTITREQLVALAGLDRLGGHLRAWAAEELDRR
jgi:MOSC domain-containing protein YiiM